MQKLKTYYWPFVIPTSEIHQPTLPYCRIIALILIVQVNLKKGTITVPPGEPEVVQHICLAFVTATLYLLVQPRPPKIEEVGF